MSKNLLKVATGGVFAFILIGCGFAGGYPVGSI